MLIESCIPPSQFSSKSSGYKMLQSSSLAMQSFSQLRWTGGVLIDLSRDAQLELGETSEVVTSSGVRKCDWSRDIRLESYLPTGVGHATNVTHMTGVVIYQHFKHV
jgi:hypothetical protein